MQGGYSILAPFYDQLNDTVDYGKWADFLESCFRQYSRLGSVGVKTVLDLGCGTGSMTIQLAKRGYDLTALDLSEEMLSFADANCRAQGLNDILFIQENMASFELYGTVDAVVCCLDGVNHLTDREDLDSCFSLVSNYLNPGGVFLFDVNTPYKFKTAFADRDYVLEDDGIMCCWRNRLNRRGDKADFVFSVFEEDSDGSWKRSDGYEQEKSYSLRQLEKSLKRCGLELMNVSADFEFSSPDKETERWYLVAGKPVKT